MESFLLDVDTPSTGGYFSSEQIDLLSIIQCTCMDELLLFILFCDQIRTSYDDKQIQELYTMDLEDAKKAVFKRYQDSLVAHDENMENAVRNNLKAIGIRPEDMDILTGVILSNRPNSMKWIELYIQTKYPDKCDEIFKLSHRIVSRERDQLKDPAMYDEMVLLNEQLQTFDTMLIGSGRIYNVVNGFFSQKDPDKRYDYYAADRDIAFAVKNHKQVRFHSLLVKEPLREFRGKDKNEILDIIRSYVEHTIDFISETNKKYGRPVIKAVDLFNEIISFDKDENGNYYNIWEKNYGITLEELMEVFKYAFEHKPEGVSYVYNEPFLEDDERRKKVLETLDRIDELAPGAIDTLGTQMHITFRERTENIKRCFMDLKKLQDEKGKNIQITEFDMSLGKSEVPVVYGPERKVTEEQAYKSKGERIQDVSRTIRESGVKLSGVTYWSLTDAVDSNLERIRSNALKSGAIKTAQEIPSTLGGLFPTHKKQLMKKIEPQKPQATL